MLIMTIIYLFLDLFFGFTVATLIKDCKNILGDLLTKKLDNQNAHVDPIQVPLKTNKKIKMDVPSDVTLIDIKTFGEAPMGVYFAKNSQLYYFSLIAETSRPLKKVLPVGEGYYVKPIDIKRDISKNVYILDEVLNEILVYSAVGKFIKKIGNLPPSSYSFDIDNNGDFIILSNKTNSIYRLSYNGRKINSLENSYNLLAYEPYYYKDKKKNIQAKIIQKNILLFLYCMYQTIF